MPSRTGHAPRSLAALIAVLLLVAFGSACTSSDDGPSVTGQIVSFEARSITEFETLTIVDEDGQEWAFVGGAFPGFTPSHLQEHQALREPIKVWYVEEDEHLRVTRIEDG